MSYLKNKDTRIEISVKAPESAADDARQLVALCTAAELKLLRKVVDNPALKQRALHAAKMFIK